MRDYWFERWLADEALKKYGTRSATVLIDGVPSCGIVREEGEGAVYVSIISPYRPQDTKVMFSR